MTHNFIKFIIAIIIVLIGHSCVYFAYNKEDVELGKNLSDKLNIWKLKNTTSVYESRQNIDVNITFKGDSLGAFFLDKESNTMVLTMLCYSFYNRFEAFDTVKFQLRFEGYPDVLFVNLSQKKLAENHQEFINTPYFYDFVEFSFIHLGYIDVLKSTQLIKHLNKIFPDIYDFEGGYWLLLYKYCIACKEPEENINEIFYFLWFASDAIYYVPAKDENSSIKWHMEYFLTTFGFDAVLLDEKFIEIYEYLERKYGY